MSKPISWGGALLALGGALATYAHYGDPHWAATVQAIGALMAALGRSLLSEDEKVEERKERLNEPPEN